MRTIAEQTEFRQNLELAGSVDIQEKMGKGFCPFLVSRFHHRKIGMICQDYYKINHDLEVLPM
jgi:hypothetical protein